MAHAVNAIIVGIALEETILAEIPGARAIPLKKGLCLVPITDELFDVLKSRYPDMTEASSKSFRKFSGPLERALESVSLHGPIAYFETEYFGGTGTQSAAVWRDGRLLMPPAKAPRGPINRALRHLGIRLVWSRDAFQIVGLDRYRSNEDSLAASQ
jgi:hypothetical protein